MPDSVTFINHATVLVQLGRINILTDPIYSRTVSFLFPRRQKAGIPFEDLPPIDYILISHNDYDHLNMKTLRRLRQRNSSTWISDEPMDEPPILLREEAERRGIQTRVHILKNGEHFLF